MTEMLDAPGMDQRISMPDMYRSGEYLEHNPTWDAEDSAWKAGHILRILQDHGVTPRKICEVGCGAGEILRQLQSRMPPECEFWGYEISPQAHELAKTRQNDRMHFLLGDFLEAKGEYDLIILADVIEHLEDYFGFLRAIHVRSTYKVLHIPLDMSVQMVLRREPIERVRRDVGHLHYFSKDTALSVLTDSGYRVLDWRYTPSVVELPKSWMSRLSRWPRRAGFRLHPDLAVRILGGYSLLVLAE